MQRWFCAKQSPMDTADMFCSVVVVFCHLFYIYVLCSVVVYLVSGTKVVLCQTIVNGVGGAGDLG